MTTQWQAGEDVTLIELSLEVGPLVPPWHQSTCTAALPAVEDEGDMGHNREFPPPIDVAKHYDWEGALGCLSTAELVSVAGYLCALVVRWIVNDLIGVGPIDMWGAASIVLVVGFLVGKAIVGRASTKRPSR